MWPNPHIPVFLCNAGNLLLKIWIWAFLNFMLCYYFSLEGVLQDMDKSNPTEKQIDAEIQVTLKHAPTWKLTEKKMKRLLVQIARIDLNYKQDNLPALSLCDWISEE